MASRKLLNDLLSKRNQTLYRPSCFFYNYSTITYSQPPLSFRYCFLQNRLGNIKKSGQLTFSSSSNVLKMKMSEKNEHNKYANSSSALYIHKWPGSRVLEMTNKSDNFLDDELTTQIQDRITTYQNNSSVSAIFITSDIENVFCRGFNINIFTHDTSSATTKKQSVECVQSLSVNISTSQKAVLAVCSGMSNGTGLGVFASSTYRLGTSTTKFRIDELEQGNGLIPIGGLSYHLAKGNSDGVEVARYLAIAGVEIAADELFSLGLITHIVEDSPEDSLAFGLAHSWPAGPGTKQYQGEVVAKEAIEELLETMHICSDSVFREGVNGDVMASPIWRRALLVPPIRLTDAELGRHKEDDLALIREDIKTCFSTDSIEECKKRLASIGKPWALRSADRLVSLDQKSVQVRRRK